MTNRVRLTGDRVELPGLQLDYALSVPRSSLQQGLEAYQHLKLDLGLQTLPVAQRREVTAFLRRLGRFLFRALFPDGQDAWLHPHQPLLLELNAHWAAYPWELLHDGERWLALEAGVVRCLPGAAPPASAAPAGPGVLAVTAQPLPRPGEAELEALYAGLGTRFVSVVEHALDRLTEVSPDFTFRTLEHAGWEAFAGALAPAPRLLWWSGFATESAWLFEGPHTEAQRAEVGRVARRLHDAVRQGLQGLVLNDSLGLYEPQQAARQARLWLEAGLPALIRIEGAHGRAREHDYVRTLVRHLEQRPSWFEGHLAAIRRLSRRFEEGWDWSYFRFHQTIGSDPLAPLPAGERAAGAARRGAGLVMEGDRERLPPLSRGMTGAPPVFRRRQRVFGRHAERRELARAVRPERPPGSPLVFLSGAPGSGKTALALDLARRTHRAFERVVYLEGRDVADAGEEAPTLPGAGLPDPSPGGALLGALARHLELAGVPEAPPAEWEGALRAWLAEGPARLLIVDHLEHHPGYPDFCEALSRFPVHCPVLLLSRQKAPLLPGFRVELEPVDEADLIRIAGEELLDRLSEHPAGPWVARQCRRDLLLARLLRRLEHMPAGGAMRPPADEAGAPGARRRLLAGTLDRAVAELGPAARQVLEALVLLTGLVHHDTVARLAGLEGRPLARALTELQWLGLAEACDGGRYLAVPHRLLGALGERVLTREAYGRLQPRLLRTYQSYLATLGETLPLHNGDGLGPGHPPLLAWRERPRPFRADGSEGALHRLGAERANLAELATMLREEGEAGALARLVGEARLLNRLRPTRDLSALLGRHLVAAGRASGGPVVEARGLNHLGHLLLAAERGEAAAPLLEAALDRLGHGEGWEVLSDTYLLLSRAHALTGHREAAHNLLNAAVELGYQLRDGAYLVSALEALARLWAWGSVPREVSHQFLPPAIRFLEESDQTFHAAQARRLLADCLLGAGALDEAATHLHEAREAFLRTGAEQDAGLTAFRIAECHVRRDAPEAALREMLQARELAGQRGSGPLQEEARALTLLSRWYAEHQQPREALRGYRQVQALQEALGDREGVIRVLDILGGLYFQMGEQEQSTRCYEERLLLQDAAAGAATPAARPP